jgi:hypothetical protein
MREPKNVALLVFVGICFLLVALALTLNFQEAVQSTGSGSSDYLVNADPTQVPISTPTKQIENVEPIGTPTPVGIEDEA